MTACMTLLTTTVELAMRLGLPLATGDRNLGAAAERVGVVLIDGTQ